MSINCSYRRNDSIIIKYKCHIHDIIQCQQDPTFRTLFFAKQVLKSELGLIKKSNMNKQDNKILVKELSHFFGIS